MPGIEANSWRDVLRLRLCPRAAPSALLSADPGRGIAWKCQESGASSLAALRVRSRILALPRSRAGVQSWGGRGRKAASSLRLHHLAQSGLVFLV
ncbi:hypothetical protein NDU88_000953 [Pleurodeles waltl]|uniref:Uncharacterized protein n=1 Tax=Pleurodeles waltl TaxID=8319 RepID=A0AAV7VV09_PLEWA|nr:hypothetical protein NDU88_000953 [Pleurodeles waltl]